MNRQQLIQHISGQTGISHHQVQTVVTTLMQIATDVFRHDENLTLRGFGTFRPMQQTERPGRNPRTGQLAPVPARTTVRFRPGKDLLALLNPAEPIDTESG